MRESLLVRAGLVYPDAWSGVETDWALLIEDGLIAATGPAATLSAAHPGVETVGDAGCIVVPGFIDAHQHGRGKPYHERGVIDQPLEEWSARFAAMRRIDVYTSVSMAAAKLLRSGVTTTLHHHVHTGASGYWTELAETVRAYRNAGIRATVALDCHDALCGVYDCHGQPPACSAHGRRRLVGTPSIGELARFVDEQRAGASESIRFSFGLRGVNWCSDVLLREAAVAADRLGVGVHLHVAETSRQYQSSKSQHGVSPVERLARANLLDGPRSLAHCVWVSERDIDLLADSTAIVVHNPASNLRLRSGIAPVLSMRAAGIPVAVGADNLFLDEQAGYLGDLRLCKALHFTGGAYLDTRDVLDMTWNGGARAVFLDGAVGCLKPGALGDLVLFRSPTLVRRAADGLPWEQAALPDLLLRVAAVDLEAVVVGGRLMTAAELSARVRELDALSEQRLRLTATEQQALTQRRRQLDEELVELAVHYARFDRELMAPFRRHGGE